MKNAEHAEQVVVSVLADMRSQCVADGLDFEKCLAKSKEEYDESVRGVDVLEGTQYAPE